MTDDEMVAAIINGFTDVISALPRDPISHQRVNSVIYTAMLRYLLIVGEATNIPLSKILTDLTSLDMSRTGEDQSYLPN